MLLLPASRHALWLAANLAACLSARVSGLFVARIDDAWPRLASGTGKRGIGMTATNSRGSNEKSMRASEMKVRC
ncbi:hypothetical protein V8C26DRAFT_386478 [Trichoderma gracile]